MSKKLKWSNFHVTINLNQTSAESESHGLVRNFANVIEEAMHDHPWDWLVRFDSGQRPFREDEKLLVESIRARVGLERDEEGKNRSVHAHIVLEVGHRTLVQVDRNGIKDFIDSALGVRSNVHVRFLEGDSSDKNFILRYITKTIDTNGVSAANRRLHRAVGPGRSESLQPADNDEVI